MWGQDIEADISQFKIFLEEVWSNVLLWEKGEHVGFDNVLIIFCLSFLCQQSGQRNWRALLSLSSNRNTCFQPNVPSLTFCIGNHCLGLYSSTLISESYESLQDCKSYRIRLLGNRPKFQLSKTMHIEAVVPVEQTISDAKWLKTSWNSKQSWLVIELLSTPSKESHFNWHMDSSILLSWVAWDEVALFMWFIKCLSVIFLCNPHVPVPNRGVKLTGVLWAQVIRRFPSFCSHSLNILLYFKYLR